MSGANKPSDNFLAESLYILAGAEVFGKGSYNASYQAEANLWKSLKVPDTEVVSIDGSGLSRRNLITPHAFVELLIEMKDEELFVSSLPLSGIDGTMRYRLTKNGMAKRVQAKTGTLTGVSSLSGYVVKNNGQPVAFSIIVNNYACSTGTIRAKIDDIVEVFAR